MQNPSDEAPPRGNAAGRSVSVRRTALFASLAAAGLLLAVTALPKRRADSAERSSAAVGAFASDGSQDEADDGSPDAYDDEFVRRFRRAQQLLGASRDAEAEKEFADLLAIHPDAAAVHHAVGHMRWAQGRTDEALRSFAEAAELAPEDGAIRRDLGFKLADAGRAAAALVHLDAARTMLEPDCEIEVYRARAQLGAGRADEAEKTMRGALEIEVNSVDARTGLAAMVLVRDPQQSLDLTKDVPESWADVVAVRSQASLRLGRTDDAARLARRLAEVAPDGRDGPAFFEEAVRTLLAVGDVSGARDAAVRWKASIARWKGPRGPASWALVLTHAASGEPAAALAQLDEDPLPATAPESLRAHVGLTRGALLVLSGHRDDALAAFRIAARCGTSFDAVAAGFLSGAAGAADEGALAASAGASPSLANDLAFVRGIASRLVGDSEAADLAFRACIEASATRSEFPAPLALGAVPRIPAVPR